MYSLSILHNINFDNFLDNTWVMVFNAIFNNISVISWCQFYWWVNPEFPEKDNK
jgi:hypothetical protein